MIALAVSAAVPEPATAFDEATVGSVGDVNQPSKQHHVVNLGDSLRQRWRRLVRGLLRRRIDAETNPLGVRGEAREGLAHRQGGSVRHPELLGHDGSPKREDRGPVDSQRRRCLHGLVTSGQFAHSIDYARVHFSSQHDAP